MKPFKSFPKPEKQPKKARQPLTRQPIKRKARVKSGELAVFQEIWDERLHVCQVTGEPIHHFDVWNFMHLLAKKPYPRFRLYKKNIYLVTRHVHTEYDDGNRSSEMFDEVNKKVEELKLEYYEQAIARRG